MNKLQRILSPKILFLFTLLFAFVVIIMMLVPELMSILRSNILIVWALLALSGSGLVWITNKENIEGKLKGFLLLTGYASAGFFVGVVLHNVFYALGTLVEMNSIFSILLRVLDGASFLFAIIICPIALIIGIVGTFSQWKNMSLIK